MLMKKATARAAPKSRSGGFSLVSTMVGLVIGLLSVLAVLSTYEAQSRQIEGTTNEPGLRQTSARNGKISVLMVMLQTELQRAGFGIDNARVGSNLVTETNSAGQVVALAWNWVDGGQPSCAALRYSPTTHAGQANERGTLQLVREVTPCDMTPLSPVDVFGWATSNGVETVAQDIPAFRFSVDATQATCTLGTDPDPSTPENAALVTITSSTSANALAVSNRFCIYNIR